MLKRIIIFFMCFSGITLMPENTFAQKTYKFKVRAPQTMCIVEVNDSLLWLDKDNRVTIQIKNQKGKIKVHFANATSKKISDNEYLVSFESAGKTMVSVHQFYKGGFKLIHSQSLKVEEPEVHFCGVKVGTKSRGFQLAQEHFRAKSIPYNSNIKIKSYDMIYFDGVSENIFHSDTTLLSQKMMDILFEKPLRAGDMSFRFGMNKRVYFSNIAAVMPDGKEKFLTPFEIFLFKDSTRTNDIAFIFAVNHIYSKKQ